MRYSTPIELIIRKDHLHFNRYSAYSITTGIEEPLSNSLFSLLSLLEVQALSHEEINSSLAQMSIPEIPETTLTDLALSGKITNTSQVMNSNTATYLAQLPIWEQKVESPIPLTTTPKKIEIHLTQQCNLRCAYCGYDATVAKAEILDVEQWKRFFDEAEALKVQLIILSGGEPFLYKRLPELLDDMKSRRIKFNVFTNGAFITKEYADKLAAPNITTSISLDGITPFAHEYLRGKHTHAKVMESINLLSRAGANYYISSTIHAQNYKEIPALVDFAIKHNAESIALSKVLPLGRGADCDWLLSIDEESHIEAELERLRTESPYFPIEFSNSLFFSDEQVETESSNVFCSAGTERITINSDGTVYPCVLNFNDPTFAAGSIANTSLQDIWTDGSWHLVRDEVPLEKIDGCSSCSKASQCNMKGCRLSAYYEKSSFYDIPPMCNCMA